MQQFPTYLNTKQDYLNCSKDFPEETKKTLQELLDNRFVWFQTSILSDIDEGMTDATHKVVISEDERSQYELREDNNSKLFQLGFSVQEVEGLIK